MPIPLQITFCEIEHSEAVEAKIRVRFDKLVEHCNRILHGHVMVRSPRRHPHKGKVYNIHIDLKLRGGEVAVNRDSSEAKVHKNIYVAIRDAFDAADRRLHDKVSRRRDEAKAEPQPRRAAEERREIVEPTEG